MCIVDVGIVIKDHLDVMNAGRRQICDVDIEAIARTCGVGAFDTHSNYWIRGRSVFIDINRITITNIIIENII